MEKIKEQWSDLNKPSCLYNPFEEPSCSLKYVTCFSAHESFAPYKWGHTVETFKRPNFTDDHNYWQYLQQTSAVWGHQPVLKYQKKGSQLRLCFVFLICYCIILFHSWFSMQASRHTSHTLRKKKKKKKKDWWQNCSNNPKHQNNLTSNTPWS